nr:MAG TPA: putative stress-responsive nuclear envelope protein [Caudoviricetes sp.]
MESKKTPNKELLDTLNTNQSFSFSENGLMIQSDERSIKVESWSVEQFENWINKQGGFYES